MNALAIRLFVGAVGLGLLIGAALCFADARTASDAVAKVLNETALLGAFLGLAALALAICCDHRTASQLRTAQRHRERMQRERNRATLDSLRARNRSRNRF